MKKDFGIIISVVTLMLLLVSCPNQVAETSNVADNGLSNALLQLNTPKVKVNAWPGCNFISWKPILDNKGYEVYRYQSDNFTNKPIVKKIPSSTCYYEDTDIQNGVSYKYEVMALGSLGGRGIATSDSKVGVATCIGNVPPLDTAALDLAAYEDGYNGEVKTISLAEQENYLVGHKIETYIENGKTLGGLCKFVTRFKAKSYLEYSIIATKNNSNELIGLFGSNEKFSDKFGTLVNNSFITNTNVDDTTELGITTSGEYSILIKVSAKHPALLKNSFVKSEEKIVVPELVTTYNLGFNPIQWVDSSKTKINISVRINYDQNYQPIPSEYYKIYKREENSKQYTFVTDGSKFIDTYPNYLYQEPMTKNDKTYVYLFVITDGINYAKSVGTYTFIAE